MEWNLVYARARLSLILKATAKVLLKQLPARELDDRATGACQRAPTMTALSSDLNDAFYAAEYVVSAEEDKVAAISGYSLSPISIKYLELGNETYSA
jgi:hypothetical protein